MSTDDFEDDKSSTSETFDMNTFEPSIKNVIISTDFDRPLAQEEDLVVFNQGKNAGNYVIGTIKRHHECCVLDPVDQMNQLTGGRVTRVKNIFKNNSEKRLVEEVRNTRNIGFIPEEVSYFTSLNSNNYFSTKISANCNTQNSVYQ